MLDTTKGATSCNTPRGEGEGEGERERKKERERETLPSLERQSKRARQLPAPLRGY